MNIPVTWKDAVMSERAAIAQAAAEGLRRFVAQCSQYPAVVGFDGFVDSIIAVVDKRHDQEAYDAIETIEKFGQKITHAAGQSSNYELVVTMRKLGGNGPIMANAMAALGVPVTYLGALGVPSIDPVFDEFAQRAKLISFANPAYTDALEFKDGKLMLGKLQSFRDVNWANLQKLPGGEDVRVILSKSRLLAMVNWTMLPNLSDIWKNLIEHVMPGLEKLGAGRRRVFVDLTDPEKRTAEDLREALFLCAAFEQYADVTLGLNLKESTQAAGVLGIDVGKNPEAQIEGTAKAIREKLNLDCVVIHPRSGAAAAKRSGSMVSSARFAGPFVQHPKISTGAGDHFNAGFVTAQLAGLPVEQCLCVGTATSGYYVRTAVSPSLTMLAEFCEALPAPQSE